MKEFNVGDQVLYVPNHAKGNHGHPDCEHGLVSSMNDRFVFVRYVRSGMLQSTGEATLRENLLRSGEPFPSGAAMDEMKHQIKKLHELVDALRRAHIGALELASGEKGKLL